MSPPAIRQRLYHLLRDELVFFLQKILRGQYRPPTGFPAMPDLNRALLGILRELRVYTRPADRDYGAAGLMERWYDRLLAAGPISDRDIMLYFVLFRGRLYDFSPAEHDRPFLFRTPRAWIHYLLQGSRSDDPGEASDAALPGGLSLHAIYAAEEQLCELIAGEADRPELVSSLRASSGDFVRELHSSCEELYRRALTAQNRERVRMQAESDHMERELRRAARVQSRSIQRELPVNPRLHFALWYEPFHTIGGDYYRVLELAPQTYGIFLADISGHGISAAMHFHTVVNSFSRCADALHSPADFLRRMNTELYGQLHDQFITAIYLRIDLAKGRLDYCNGGHPKAFLAALPETGAAAGPAASPGGTPKKVRFLRPNGKVLGAFPRVDFQSQSLTLDERNRLIVYTDGISEAARHPNSDGAGTATNARGAGDFELLGERGLLDLFDARTTGWSPERTLEHVRTSVNEFSGGELPADDRTLLLIDIDRDSRPA